MNSNTRDKTGTELKIFDVGEDTLIVRYYKSGLEITDTYNRNYYDWVRNGKNVYIVWHCNRRILTQFRTR